MIAISDFVIGEPVALGVTIIGIMDKELMPSLFQKWLRI